MRRWPDDDVAGELEVVRELTGYTNDAVVTSAETGQGLDELAGWRFRHLEVVRVYTKIPHQPPDLGRPNTLRKGDTVLALTRRRCGPSPVRQAASDHLLAGGA